MAATILDLEANEKSTYVITASFFQEDDTSVVPESITWTLTDDSGTVINDRSQVSVTPASSVNIVLTGDDLAIGGSSKKRIVTIEAVYNSSLYGDGLTLKKAASFTINDLVAIS